MMKKFLITWLYLCYSSTSLAQDIIFSWIGVIPPPTTLAQSIRFDKVGMQEMDMQNTTKANPHLTIEKTTHEKTQTEILILSVAL
ncbi:hypothetical protein [Vibrio parahaemolyticus]|uniref:hypothetical protein n=1 Tax=Vibrio parahaemolyticus TaxID=670 RepID=UPI00112197FE|nr:hypothetical protein [Vibrio parahaemolyticus]TOK27483.1 hypothetical protein CGI22_04740 [Vibrio parahaemolyticus]